MTVETIPAWIAVTDEMIVDYSWGTPEQVAEAVARLQAIEDERERQWRALPWYIRTARTLRLWRWRVQEKGLRRLHAALFPDHDQ